MRRFRHNSFLTTPVVVIGVLLPFTLPFRAVSNAVAQEANQPVKIGPDHADGAPPTPEANRPREAALDDRARETPDGAGETATREGLEVDSGLWPSRKLMRSMLTRMADDMVGRYGLSDDKRDQVRNATVDRWMDFLSDNRTKLQPLVNEFLEMRLALEPPFEEQVKEWAERALPVFDETRSQIEQNWNDLREVLNPWQRAKFEIDALATKAGLEVAQRRLTQWKQGQFELTDVWEPRDRAAQRQARERRAAERAERRERIEAEASAAEPSDQIELELDSWDRYAAEFISKHDLDEAQRDSVRSTLTEVKARAQAHRDRHREEIVELERRIEAPDPSDDDREAIKGELVRLYGPIDELFAELQRRLDSVPTESQKSRAGEIERAKAAGKAENGGS
jgi:hypothetical protein